MEDGPQNVCENCFNPINTKGRYCVNCGSSLVSRSAEEHGNYRLQKLKEAGIFYAVEIVVCLCFDFVNALHTLNGLILFHILTAINAIIFVTFNSTTVVPVLTKFRFSFLKLLLFIGAAALSSLIVNFSVSKLDSFFSSDPVDLHSFFVFYPYPKALTIFFVAFLPAVFEELAYRGYLLQTLRQVVDDKQAIFISAFLFAIIHISFISLYWLLPFALILGYLCVKENSLWYGVLIHFVFNLTACLIDFYSLF